MEQSESKSSLSYNELTLQQRHIYSLVKDWLRKPESERVKYRLRVVVTGTAGSGKSSLLLQLKALLDEHIANKEKKFNYIISSYTGISAKQIDGTTIHHSFGFPLSPPRTEVQLAKFLKNWRKTDACARLRTVSLVIIDELSFLGQHYFVLIDKLLRAAKPSQFKIPFGGCSVILVGDLYQLLPIDQRPLYHPADSHPSYELYKTLTTIFVLEQVFRQGGQSVKQKQYRAFLDRLRHKKSTAEDVELIRTRRAIALQPQEKAKFKDALRIFPYRSQVIHYNSKAIRERFPESILFIQCHGKLLEISVGCSVIFTENIPSLTYKGVTNSTVGKVRAISLKGNRPPVGFCKVSDVLSIAIELTDDELVYVKPSDCRNNNLPIAPNFAITCHKAQGLSVPKVVAFLGVSELATKWDYIIFSRVRSLEDIMIVDSFINSERLVGRRWADGDYVETENKRLKRLQHSMYKDNIVKSLNRRSMGFNSLCLKYGHLSGRASI